MTTVLSIKKNPYCVESDPINQFLLSLAPASREANKKRIGLEPQHFGSYFCSIAMKAFHFHLFVQLTVAHSVLSINSEDSPCLDSQETFVSDPTGKI